MTRPTMSQVAERAGVSRALVSLVLRDLPNVSDETRERIVQAAADLNYVAETVPLPRDDRHRIGVLVNDPHNPFFLDVADAFVAEAEQHGSRVIVMSGWGRHAGESAAIETMLDLSIDGLVLGAPKMTTARQREYARRLPCVSINTYGEPPEMDTVCNDELTGALLAVDHLASLGHTRIAHLAAESPSAGPARRDAFVTAMAERDLEPIIGSGDFTEDAGHAGTLELLSSGTPPTAIVATNDLAAVGALAAAKTLGFDVPRDLSIIGYDDTLLAGMRALSLTSVRQPTETMGALAASLLRSRIDGRQQAEHHLTEPTLVIRQSTAAPSS